MDELASSGVRLARGAPARLRAERSDAPPELGEPRSELRHVHPSGDHLRVEVLAQQEEIPGRGVRVSMWDRQRTLTFALIVP
jgi:hypothetical protein